MSRTAVSVPAVLNVPVIGTCRPSVPVAVPVTVYAAPNARFCPSVQLVRSGETVPATGAPSGPVIVRVSMTPRATLTVTGCAGAIPVAPNPGDADTAATGAAGEVIVVGALLVVTAPTGDASPDTGGPAVAGADVTMAVEDNAPVPQPATTVRTATTAITAGGRHRKLRRVPCLAVIAGPAGDPAVSAADRWGRCRRGTANQRPGRAWNRCHTAAASAAGGVSHSWCSAQN